MAEAGKSLALVAAARSGSVESGAPLVDALSRLLPLLQGEIFEILSTRNYHCTGDRPRPEPALSLWCENRQPFTLVQYSFKILGDIWAPDFIWNPIVLLGLA